MAHFVYVSVGMPSTLHSSVELGRRLREAGHRVTFISHRDIAQDIELAGFPFHRLSADQAYRDAAREDPMPGLAPWKLPRLAAWVRRRRRLRAASAANREITDLVRTLAPDSLLIDIECHFAVIATATLRIPVFLTMFWFSIFRSPGLPPLHTSLPPPATPRQRLAVSLAWWRARLAKRSLALAQRLGNGSLRAALRPIPYGTVRYHELERVARAHGYVLTGATDRSQWLRPFAYRHLPVLCFNVLEMEFPHQPHRNLNYVGPMINADRSEARIDASAAAWDRYKARRAAEPDRNRPLIYCSLGSYWSGDQAFLRRVIAVFEGRAEWDLVLGLGGRTAPEALEPVPDNVMLLNWAPQLDVLKLANCAITHGGITTINECIDANVPMVVYSTGYVDQDGCAARVAWHRLGIAADKETATPEKIEANIERCLADPELRAAVAGMREVFAAYRRDNAAVRILEARAQTMEHPDRPTLLFLHIPKNAGTAIESDATIRQAGELLSAGHCLSWQRARKRFEAVWDAPRTIRFAVVRGPWDRLRSLFRYAIADASHHHNRRGTTAFGIHLDYFTLRHKSLGECIGLLYRDRQAERDEAIRVVGLRVLRHADLEHAAGQRRLTRREGLAFHAARALSRVANASYACRVALSQAALVQAPASGRMPPGLAHACRLALSPLLAALDHAVLGAAHGERHLLRGLPGLHMRNLLHPGWRDQHPYVYDGESGTFVVEVARFERLEDDLSRILDMAVTLRAANVTPARRQERRHAGVSERLSRESVAAVQEIYAEDFRILGYPADPPVELLEPRR